MVEEYIIILILRWYNKILSSQHFFNRVTGNRVEEQYQHDEYGQYDDTLQNLPFVIVPNYVPYGFERI